MCVVIGLVMLAYVDHCYVYVGLSWHISSLSCWCLVCVYVGLGCVFHFGLYSWQCVVLMLVWDGVLFIVMRWRCFFACVVDVVTVVYDALWYVYVGVS